MGSQPSKPTEPKVSELATKDGTVGQEEGMPEPFPSIRKRKDILKGVNFAKIDNKTCNVPPTLLFGSFWDLVEHLVIATNFEALDDIYRVRAIFRYLTLYNVFNIESDILPPPESPLEYMMKIQWEFGDHAHMFWALATMANIPCVIINGVTKHGMYELGDKVDRESLHSRWNAVFINGEWRLLDVFWATSYDNDHERYDKITMDEKGNISHVTNAKSHMIDEYYFLTDPEELIYTHLPDDPAWQLLEKPLTQTEYERMPYLRERFFELELKVPEAQKNRKCFFRSKGKPISVMFELPEKPGKNYKFKYDLFQTRFDEDQQRNVNILLDSYVMMEHTKKIIRFTFQLPIKGMFRFDVYGMDSKMHESLKLVCSYGILGTITNKKCEPFPSPPEHGWGLNSDFDNLGIVPIGQKDGYIVTDTGVLEVKIATNKAKVSHVLKTVTSDDASLSRHAIGRYDDDVYIINIRLPKDGNYSLMIYTPINGEHVNIMGFLIICNAEKVQNQPFPNVIGTQLGSKSGADNLGVKRENNLGDLMVAWDGKIDLAFTAPEDVCLCYELNCNDKVGKEKMKGSEKREGSRSIYSIAVPKQGIYTINVFGYMKYNPEKMNEVYSGFIHSTGTPENADDASKKKKVKINTKESKKTTRQSKSRANNKELSEITGEIVQTIKTSDSVVKLPVPKATGSMFTTLRRCDMPEDQENTDGFVVVKGDNIEIKMKKEADYQLNIFSKHASGEITTIARYTIAYQKKTVKTADDQSDDHSEVKSDNIINATPADNSEGVMNLKNESLDDMQGVKSGGFITFKEEDFATEMKDENGNIEKPTKHINAKMHVDKPTYPEVSLRDLDGLVKSLHKKYDIHVSTKPIGLNAYFDPKDTEKAREDLVFAALHREPTMLEEALDRAKEANKNQSQLTVQIKVARKLLGRLSKIERVSSARRLTMDSKSLAEVKQYTMPPYGVHHTVAATFLLLGDELDTLKIWTKCQALMSQLGKGYIFRRMNNLNPKDVPENTIATASRILKPFNPVAIRDVSKGAATFYAWVRRIIREHESNDEMEVSVAQMSKRIRPRSSKRPVYESSREGTIVVNM